LEVQHRKTHAIAGTVCLEIDREAVATDILFGLDFHGDDLIVPLYDKLHFCCSW
jgi:hypothetical protein